MHGRVGGGFFSRGITAASVGAWLAELSEDDREIEVSIDSPGGSLFDGLAIYRLLARDDRRVIVYVDGLAASAASVIAMAGDEIRMGESTFMMIHNASAVTIGTADDHEKTAEDLRKFSSRMASLYAARTGHDKAKIQNMMNAETWLDGNEAKAKGFATHVDPDKSDDSNASASWGEKEFELLASFENAPARYKQEPRQFAIAAETNRMQKNTRDRLCRRLGLPENAADETILAAVENQPEPVQATPDPALWVSRSDFDALAAKVDATVAAIERKQEIDAALAGVRTKMTPAQQRAWRSQLESGKVKLDSFREIMGNAPELAVTQEDPEGPKAATNPKELGLSDIEIEFCDKNGKSYAEYAARKEKRIAQRSDRMI